MAAAEGFGAVHPAPSLDQWHLRRQVEALQHFNWFIAAPKAHVFGTAIGTATHQPAGVVHQTQQTVELFCRNRAQAVAADGLFELSNSFQTIDNHRLRQPNRMKPRIARRKQLAITTMVQGKQSNHAE